MANDSKDRLGAIKHDSKDALDEGRHRAQAAAEHHQTGSRRRRHAARRPRLASNVNETVHKTQQAEIDRSKRDMRHGMKDADKG